MTRARAWEKSLQAPLSAATRLALAGFAAFLLACSAAREDVETRVLASLGDRNRGGSAVSVDSIRLGDPEGSTYTGFVFLSSGGQVERDSIRVKADFSGLEYDFPKPGPLLNRMFGQP